ncbi:MAG: protein phosphatase 2C domain-containing protein [Candidatus Micrarchaeota archaeon]
MSEQHSYPHKRFLGKPGSDYGRRFIRTSVSGSMGIFPGDLSLNPLLGARLGLPGFDTIIRSENVKEIATRDELLEGMSIVIRSGKPEHFSHPSLPGMEFGSEQIDSAVLIAFAAQVKLAGGESEFPLISYVAQAVKSLGAIEEYGAACGVKDRKTQMSLALVAYTIELRAKELSEKFSIHDSHEQAAKDVETARSYVEEYRNPPSAPGIVLRGVRRMKELAKEGGYFDISDFELALAVIDQEHMKREPLSTLRPPPGSLSQVPPSAIPQPTPMPSDLAPPEELPAKVAPTKPEPAAPAEAAAPEVPAATAPAPVPQAQVVAEPPSELPVFDFPFPNSIFDKDLEPILPPKTDKRNVIIRKVARALISYKLYGIDDENIDPRCLGAVRSLKISYSQAAVLDFATSIVDGKPIRAVAPTLIDVSAQAAAPAPAIAPTLVDAPAETGTPARAIAPTIVEGPAEDEAAQEVDVQEFAAPEVTRPDIRSASYYLSQMEDLETELVAGAMNEQSCDEETLSRFLALRPAHREMLIERFIASRWTEGGFRTEISRARRAKEMLYSACGLEFPTEKEKLEEISDPANLLDSQVNMIAQLFHTSEVTEKHIEAFRVWVSNDPSVDHDRTRLAEYWNNKLLTEGGFNISSGMWMRPSREDRLRFWHLNARDAISAGSLAHNLRFRKGSQHSMGEIGMISHICGKSWEESSSLSQQDRDDLVKALTHHTYKESRQNIYYPEILTIAKSAAMEGPSLVRKAARDEAEYNILLDFMGVQIEAARGTLVRSHGMTQAKRSNGVEKPNEDSWSSAIVTLHDGTDIALDMVADGMGGHNKGSNGGMTNGQTASALAREIFEISAVAGWIREPEDVRKMILIADQTIVADQIKKKAMKIAHAAVTKRWEDSGVDVTNMHPDWLPEYHSQVMAETLEALSNIDPVQTNDMGTTMTVAFQRKNELWFIHCGDSDGKLIRDGRVIFKTTGHSAEYDIRLEAKASSRAEVEAEYRGQGIDPAKLDKAGLEALESRADAIYQEKTEMMKEFFKNNANVVSSVLGVKPYYVHINNADHDYQPLEVEDSDIIEVSSDGKSVPVCDHETPLIAFGKCMGDLDEARSMLVAIAANRAGKGPHKTLCECKEREGKVDDITLIMRYGEEGILEKRREYFSGNNFIWLTRRMTSNPTELALSKNLRLIIEGASDQETEKDSLLRLFDAIIKTAESAPPSSSGEAYSFALSLISTIISKRHDRDEIVADLVPIIGSWGGLMLKKLRECPDASARRRVMFDIAAKCVPAEELQGLLRARNPVVAAWAGNALGAVPEPSSPKSEMPHSIFNSQHDAHWAALDPWSTRYLDMPVLEIHGSSVVQDTAKRLGLLPRDLEIMVFYAYADYAPEVALNPHESAGGDNLIASVGNHLCTKDAERILVASMLLWRFREWPPATEVEAKRLAKELWDSVGAMNQDAPYGLMFHLKAYAYRGLLS